MSRLRREYLSSTVNVLTNHLKILNKTKRDFFRLKSLQVINKDGKAAIVEISTVFQPVYHVACQRVLQNRTF